MAPAGVPSVRKRLAGGDVHGRWTGNFTWCAAILQGGAALVSGCDRILARLDMGAAVNVLKGTRGERALIIQILASGLEPPQREYRWAAELVGPGRGVRQRLADAGLRDWRFDFAWPARRLAVEVEGATWAQGRHTRGSGFEGDCEKYNAATLHGWRVLRHTTAQVLDGRALADVKRALSENEL